MIKLRFQKTIEYLKYWKGVNEKFARVGTKYKAMKEDPIRAKKQNAEIIKEIDEAIKMLGGNNAKVKN